MEYRSDFLWVNMSLYRFSKWSEDYILVHLLRPKFGCRKYWLVVGGATLICSLCSWRRVVDVVWVNIGPIEGHLEADGEVTCVFFVLGVHLY